MPGRGMYLSVVDRARYAEQAMDAYTAVLDDPDDVPFGKHGMVLSGQSGHGRG